MYYGDYSLEVHLGSCCTYLYIQESNIEVHRRSGIPSAYAMSVEI